MATPTQAEYEQRESREFHSDLQRIERDWRSNSATERKQDLEEFYEAMRDDPALIADRVEWLIDGNYGKGAYDAARDVLSRPRMNIEAWLVQIIGALEWHIPPRHVAAAWKKLTVLQQAKLTRVLDKVIREAKTEIASQKATGRRGVSKRRVTTRRR